MAVGEDHTDDPDRPGTGQPHPGPPAPGWSRRAFLARTGTAAGAVALGGAAAACSGPESTSAGPADDDVDLDLDDHASVRGRFALTTDYRFFNAWVLAPHPRPVADAIDGFRHELDEAPWRAYDQQAGRERSARQALGGYFGVGADEIALTGGTAQALGFLYQGIRLDPGHEILTVRHDYHTDQAARAAAVHNGAEITRAGLFGDEIAVTGISTAELVVRLLDGLTDATRVVAVPWLLPDTGLKLPIPEIADALATFNEQRDEDDRILLCVDGSHAVGVEPTDLPALGCDFFVAGLDHWMFGPRGTGFCWGHEAAWSRFRAPSPGRSPLVTEAWLADEPAPPTNGATATPADLNPEHRWAVTSAVNFQSRLGRDAVVDHTRRQADALKEGLADIGSVTPITPPDQDRSSALVCFRPDEQDPNHLVNHLRFRFVIADVAPFAPGLVRLGPSIVTDDGDVDAVLDAVAALS